MSWFVNRKFGEVEYKVFLPLLYFTVIILLAISIYGLYANDWSLEQKPYMVCNSKSQCFNTLYNSPSCDIDKTIKDTPICTQEYVPSGFTYGSKPLFIVEYLNVLVFSVFGLFLFFNTILFNKEFLRDVKLRLK